MFWLELGHANRRQAENIAPVSDSLCVNMPGGGCPGSASDLPGSTYLSITKRLAGFCQRLARLCQRFARLFRARDSPGSASEFNGYGGSRRQKARFSYTAESMAGFIELAAAHSRGPKHERVETFRQDLLAVPGVESVSDHPKGPKGPSGDHFQERSFFVRSRLSGNASIEFGLTRHGHMKEGANRPFTVSAYFRTAAREHVPEAWRILRAACRGKELIIVRGT